MRDAQQFNPLGHLNTDTSPEYVGGGDYTNALDISHLTESTESTQGIIPKRGNVKVFDLGSVGVQNKTWRIYTSNFGAAQTGGIFVYDQSGNLFPTINAQTQPLLFNRFQSIVLQAADILADFTNIDGAGNTTVVATTTDATVGAEVGYIDITMDTITGYDWGMEVRTAVGAPAITDTAMVILTTEEAYDLTLTGELNDIAGYDLLGDEYIWSTPQKFLPTIISPVIDGVTLVAAPFPVNFQYQVSTVTAHGLTTGMKVVTADILYTGAPLKSPNGIWIIEVITTTTFNLLEFYNPDPAAVFVYATPNQGTVTLYTEAVGEIGAAVKDLNTNVWTYTRLLRTKEWNFRTLKQMDTIAERNEIKDSVYWTDDYNVPRVFYYTKPYIADGGLSINGGRYDYGSIAEETKLLLSSTAAGIIFTGQVQAGGAVRSGNWRYAIRFLSDSLSPTEWSDLTNPVNVYSASTAASAYDIIGDDAGITTPKINQLQVDGIIPGLFKYIELAGVNYVGDAIEGFVIKRVLLDSVSSTISIDHTGTETDVTNLDLGTLNTSQLQVVTAKNMTVIDKRMVLSNLTVTQQQDFSAWAETFTHSLIAEQIDAVRGNIQGTLRLGEYEDPDNVNMHMGYMHNEVYRFGVKVRFKETGFWSDVFWVDDIVINCAPTNTDIFGTPITTPSRRIGGLADFDLTDVPGAGISPNFVNVVRVYFSWSNDFLIDGIKIRDLIDRISFERSEVVSPRILATGVSVVSVEGDMDINTTMPPNIIGAAGVAPNVPGNIMEFPFWSGRTATGANIANPLYTSAEFAGKTYRRAFAFYSPDERFNKIETSFLPGDQIINYGNPTTIPNSGYLTGTNIGSNYMQYRGDTGRTFALPPSIITLSDGSNVGYGSVFAFSGIVKNYWKLLILYDATSLDLGADAIFNSPVFVDDGGTALTAFGGQLDRGGYYTQYYRPVTDQYGDITTTQYVTTGAEFDLNASSFSIGSLFVGGGDTFTQINYFKHRFPQVGDPAFPLYGFGGGVSYYSQNRINSQMRNKSASQTAGLYPAIPTATWLESDLNVDGNAGEDYNNGYNIRNQVQSDIAFDPNSEFIDDLPARIVWSELKPQNATQDNYRIMLPLNFHDLDQTDGEIVHHANGNGELITWQWRNFMRQYFNARGQLQTNNNLNIIIGDGSVMSRDGQKLSAYGCQNKWSVVRGKSKGGNDVFYWMNVELKKALRFGYDGTVSIGDIKDIQSFLANNLTWVDGKDTPADEQGIHGVWDDRFSEVVWAVRGKNSTIDVWDPLGGYTLNAVAYYSSDPFHLYGDAYKSISVVINTGHQPDISPAFWEKLPMGSYVNEYSLIFNEFKSGFTCFHTPIPRIYNKWKDSYLSPRPISVVSEIYEHHLGDYATWYFNGSTSETSVPFIEGVINKGYPETKWYEAIAFDTDIVPFRVEFATKDQVSYLDAAEFETREDSSYAPIKEDSTITVNNPGGLNDANTTLLFGKWLKVKMFFETAVYNRLLDFNVKFRISPRTKNK